MLGMGTLALAALGAGCVSDRPSRNGVFNENIYLRKSFLVRPGEGGREDTGWILKTTVVSASSPNPLAALDLWPGVENGGMLVRFRATQDKLQLLNIREMTNSKEIDEQSTRTPEVVMSWGSSNVDLKYRVNLDGEKTNFLEENQELNWQTRQWVKVGLNRNDAGDFAAFGTTFQYVVERCADTLHVASTIEPDSVKIDENNDYMEWKVNLTLPVQFDNEACLQAYGEAGNTFQKLGRNNVTLKLKYSFMRATAPEQITYKPLALDEKDPIRRKYGAIRSLAITRDYDSGLLAGKELVWRFDPEKPLTYYFAKGFPEQYKPFFTGPKGIVEQTNEIFEKSGAKIRMTMKEWNADGIDREIGDVRYNFIRWQSDLDVGAPFLGVAQFIADPRTGETLSSTINIADAPLKEYVAHRIDAYLKTVGASYDLDSATEWPDPTIDGTVSTSCKDGQTIPLVDKIVADKHNGQSSLFTKMQEYLNKPQGTYDKLGPKDFIATHDETFYKTYFQTIAYQIHADPNTNAFVVPEGGQGVFGPAEQFKALEKEAQFHKLAARIDRGETPYSDVTGPNGAQNAAEFLNRFRELTLAHRDYLYKRQFRHITKNAQFDTPEVYSIQNAMARAARHCVNGRWETKQEWLDNLLMSYRALVVWHEFGHILGLEHNFMGSVDRPNWPQVPKLNPEDPPRYGLYSSSLMEYNMTPDRTSWANETGGPGWGPYDRGAIGWIYANTNYINENKELVTTKEAAPNGKSANGTSGQVSPTAPWKDPLGFEGDQEKAFLFCSHEHMQYTPLCRTFDFGSTPSEIIASDLDNYEWQYRWRNFRTYRKFWDNAEYANTPAHTVVEMRRFLSMWAFDWGETGLIDMWRRIGIHPPEGTPSLKFWYDNLVDHFTKEMSSANTMAAAFHKAVIQQASGERPYRTIYDKFFGDVTQQGIILDKLFAMQGWVGMWPSDNYDPNQAGSYVASYSMMPEESYQAISEDAVTSMIGEQYYDAYPYFKPLAVVQFQMDTHSANFWGRIETRDWAGGYVFYRDRDMLDFFRRQAVKAGALGCTSLEDCTYDPTRPRAAPAEQYHSDTFNEFVGPDGRRWTWAYIRDRNVWVFADRDRNTATYRIVNDYVINLNKREDDGTNPGNAYGLELPMKYFLDSFTQYN